MSSNNSCSLLILFSLLFLSANLTVSSSCPSKSGAIDIPFPFGIGKGCYLEEWYAIECKRVNNSGSRKLVPFLSALKKEVVSIDLWQTNQIRVKNEIVSKGCSSDGRDKIESHLDLTGTPFYFAEGNSLVAVGCDVTASLTHIERSIVVCESSCNTTYSSPTNLVEVQYLARTNCYLQSNYIDKSCTDSRFGSETSCNGTECCLKEMPAGYQKIVGVKIDTTTTTRGCNVAFLTNEPPWSNETDSQRLYAKHHSTIVLGWFIHTMNRSFEDSLGCGKLITKYKRDQNYDISCVCDHNAFLNASVCGCTSGYEGNPYIPGGCKDINECQDDHNICLGFGGVDYTCANLQGTFKCSNHRPLIIGLSSGFGALIIFVRIYFLFIFIKKQRVIRQKKKFFKRNGGLLLQQQLSATEGNVEKTKVFRVNWRKQPKTLA